MKGFVDLVKESVDFSDVKKAATSNSSQPLDLIATSVKIEITPTRPTGVGTTSSKVETTMEEKLKDQKWPCHPTESQPASPPGS